MKKVDTEIRKSKEKEKEEKKKARVCEVWDSDPPKNKKKGKDIV